MANARIGHVANTEIRQVADGALEGLSYTHADRSATAHCTAGHSFRWLTILLTEIGAPLAGQRWELLLFLPALCSQHAPQRPAHSAALPPKTVTLVRQPA